MDVDVASSEIVPRYADLALFLCGTALRNIRMQLPAFAPVTLELYTWYLRKVCFLHALPNDEDGETVPERDSNAGCWQEEGGDSAQAAGSASSAQISAPFAAPHAAAKSFSREVNFRTACAQLRTSTSFTAPPLPPLRETAPEDDGGVAGSAAAPRSAAAAAAGRVHARSPSEVSEEGRHHDTGAVPALVERPMDAGFAIIEELLRIAQKSSSGDLVRRVAAALIETLVEHREPPGTPAGILERRTAPRSTSVRVATLSLLFDEDLLDDELSTEAGNATRSFHIWVNYEWASASFTRQSKMAAVASRWLRALYCYRDAETALLSAPLRGATVTGAAGGRHAAPSLSASHLARMPTNLRDMYTALEGVFEGHANTRTLLMEMALMQRSPQLSDNALARLLFSQGPSVAAAMSRAELTNRGTQPILTCITSGMLLYGQYFLGLGSLSVARQCVRVALQVAQEVHSNSILALAHHTAHAIAVHHGRPTDAANSIAIALQLTLGSSGGDGAAGDSGGSGDGVASSGAVVDGQMASVVFAGAAQLLIFFPGAVSAALRSVLSTGRLGGASRFADGDDRHAGEEAGDAAGRSGGAVAVQSVPQSLRHALLRSEAALLHTPPAEGRWVAVVARLHRETLLMCGAVYGVAVTPTYVSGESLAALADEVDAAAAVASPFFAQQARRSLFWEVVRHSAHHALCLQEGLLAAEAGVRQLRSTRALRCLHDAYSALEQRYGPAGAEEASQNCFFSSVVRYCVARRLMDAGYAGAAYTLLTRVSDGLAHAAGAEGHVADSNAHSSGGASVDSAAGSDSCWPPDHLYLFALVQRSRAEVATFLGYVAVQQECLRSLLAVSARSAFTFGLLTAQLVEARLNHSNGRYNTALDTARRVERSAARIGYPGIVDAALAAQVTAHCSSGSWRAAQRALCRRSSATAQCSLCLLLHKYCVHLELLLSAAAPSQEQVQALTRSWLKALRRDAWLQEESTSLAVGVEVPLAERLCLLSTLLRASNILGADPSALQSALGECLHAVEQRQCVAVPDTCEFGSCGDLLHWVKTGLRT